jgi:two-component sensor histidine kinase
MSFGMALHELTTNALKNGSLSPEGGTLEIL